MENIEINHELVEEIYINKKTNLNKIAYRRTNNKDISEDIIQNAMEDICKSIGTRKNIYNLDAWVYTILKYKCYKSWRNKNKIEYYPDEILNSYIEKNENDIIENINLTIALETINKKERDFIIYKYIYGFKNTEIAKIFNCSDKTVSKRINKTLQKLREKLKEI